MRVLACFDAFMAGKQISTLSLIVVEVIFSIGKSFVFNGDLQKDLGFVEERLRWLDVSVVSDGLSSGRSDEICPTRGVFLVLSHALLHGKITEVQTPFSGVGEGAGELGRLNQALLTGPVVLFLAGGTGAAMEKRYPVSHLGGDANQIDVWVSMAANRVHVITASSPGPPKQQGRTLKMG
ncbi:hypothetical protein NE237_014309 [Protea cynaroides]|uniref:Uncharacterized protein n=1 Tax=Protea cynaroides TaxID=273540 RepID=A0A9Q0GPX7_9MAGN|nr:hypothetical protein NE237_014309 [Protea cynaroides]